MSFLKKLRSLVSFRRPEPPPAPPPLLLSAPPFFPDYTVDPQGETTKHDLTPFRKGQPWDAKEIRSLLKHVAKHGEGYWEYAVPGRTAYGSADQWTRYYGPLVFEIGEKLSEIRAQREALRSNEV